MDAKDRIIVALDVENLSSAKRAAEGLMPHARIVKFGLELSGGAGDPAAIAGMRHLGLEVFLDKKWYDIPTTMAKSAAVAAGQGVRMFNIHASAGREGAARVAAVKGDTLLLAVTVLTSFDDETCIRVYGADTRDTVDRLADLVHDCGIDGVICAPTDIGPLKAKYPHLKLVTPGVRSPYYGKQDQKRVLTPAEAVGAGADWIVTGRQVLEPALGMTPAQAFLRIAEEIDSVS